MERLAAQGIRFNQFYAMSVCSPTRNSIMTGQNAARHRATNWIRPDSNNAGPQGPPDWNWDGLKIGDVTLPGVLSEAGYRSIHVGKAHFGHREAEGAEPEVIRGAGKKLELIEFISADLGFERGARNESTFKEVTNYLLENNFVLIEFSDARRCALFRNKKYFRAI